MDELHTNSYGGALLLKASDLELGLSHCMATYLLDCRETGKVLLHTRSDMLRQRISDIACGHGDTNDTARIGLDSMYKLPLNKDSLFGDDLASQPTLSRFEDRHRRVDQYRLGEAIS